MFGKRKPKPEEDEPLVPHGLIWHATAEPNAEPSRKAEPLRNAEPSQIERHPREESKKPNLAAVNEFLASLRNGQANRHVVEMPRPAQPAAKQQQSILDLRKPNAPLSWPWGLEIEEERPAAATQSSPSQEAAKENVTAQPAAQVAKETEIVGEPKAIAASDEQPLRGKPSSAKPSAPAQPGALSMWAGELRSAAKEARIGFSLVGKEFAENCTRISTSVNFRQRASHAGAQAKHVASNGFIIAREFANAISKHLLDASRTAARQGQRVSAAATDRIRLISIPAKIRERKPLAAVSVPHIRVQLQGAPLRAKIFVMRQLSEWKMESPADSRLRASMTLAVISALIALAIVSVVPRYAARSLPSRIVKASSITSSTKPLTQANIIVKTPVSKKSTTAKPATAKQVPLQAAPKGSAHPKHHRSEEDDYVAPDTYKYYGNATQASR